MRRQHRAGAHHRHVFIGRALDRRDRVSAVVADQVQDIHAMQQSTFSVCVVVPAASDESKQITEMTHAPLHRNFLAAFSGRI